MCVPVLLQIAGRVAVHFNTVRGRRDHLVRMILSIMLRLEIEGMLVGVWWLWLLEVLMEAEVEDVAASLAQLLALK